MKKSVEFVGYLLYAALTGLCACNGNGQNLPLSSDREVPAPATLVFQSGFEGTSHVALGTRKNQAAPWKVTPGYAPDDITGVDNTLPGKNNWVADLDQNPEAGNFLLEYTGGDSTQRTARIIPEPGHPTNKVLAFQLNDSWEASEHQRKARVQADIYGIRQGYKEFYQSVRVFLPEGMRALRTYPDAIQWLTISEFWNNEWWVPKEPYGFRVTLGIGKPSAAESDLFFILNAEDYYKKEVWNANKHQVKVPIGKWFTMDYYFKEGNQQTGRFYLAITPDGEAKQMVFNVIGYTHNTLDPHPNGVTGYNPMKLYTSKELVAYMRAQGRPLQIYWDDFKLWKNKRPE